MGEIVTKFDDFVMKTMIMLIFHVLLPFLSTPHTKVSGAVAGRDKREGERDIDK